MPSMGGFSVWVLSEGRDPPPQAQKSSHGSVILSCQLEDKVPSHRGAPKLGQHAVPTAGKQHFIACFAALSGACASLAVCSAVVPL